MKSARKEVRVSVSILVLSSLQTKSKYLLHSRRLPTSWNGSTTAVASAYVMAKVPSVYPMNGGRRIEHLQDSTRALEIRLSPEQINDLESAIAFDMGFPMNFLGGDPKVRGGRGGQLLASAAFVD